MTDLNLIITNAYELEIERFQVRHDRETETFAMKLTRPYSEQVEIWPIFGSKRLRNSKGCEKSYLFL